MSSLKHTVVYNVETKQIIKPAGMKAAFNNAVEYDPVRDKGKLVCIHCKQAKMTHRDRKEAIGGGNIFGWNAHFATIGSREPLKKKFDATGAVIPYTPNVHKKDCVASVVDTGQDPSEIDKTKGYKIYIDLGHIKRVFRQNASLVQRDPSTHRIVNMDPDLIDRERINLKSPKDLVTALKHLDSDRLKRSVIVSGGEKYTWNELFIRKGSQNADHPNKRWVKLGKNLLNDTHFPIFAHISLIDKKADIKSDPRDGERLRYHLGTVVVGHPIEHRKITVKFWVNIRNEHMFDMIRESEVKEFIGLTEPHSYFDSRDRDLLHVDLSFRDPKRIMEVDLHDLTHEAKKNAEARQAPPTPSIAA